MLRRLRPVGGCPALPALPALLALVALVALTAVATGTVSVAAVPAAGAAEVLDRKSLSKRVGAAVAAAHPDLPVTKVKCRPKQVKRKPGATATCIVTAGTYPLEMLVTVTGTRGRVTIASTQAVIPKASAEYLVALNATLPAVADCGPAAYIVKKPGESFTCTASFEGGAQSVVTLTPTDVAGNATVTAAT